MDESILLVDDDPNLLAALQRQLHKGFNITAAHDGNEALATIDRAKQQQQSFAVVVCDMRLPGMDGIEVLRRIKALSPDTVRIMLTGNADTQTAIDAINTGNVFRFFCKPCPPEELAEGLRAAIAEYRSATAERELLERLGYPKSKEWHTQTAGALGGGEPGAAVEGEPAKPPPTAAETRKDIQDMVGYDIVNHDRLLALAENIWRSVPANKRAQYTAKEWQADIYDKCQDALVKAEKKLGEANPDPRMLRASINILRSAFARQVVRAMQEISVYYRDYHAKAQAKTTPKIG